MSDMEAIDEAIARMKRQRDLYAMNGRDMVSEQAKREFAMAVNAMNVAIGLATRVRAEYAE